MHLCLVHALHDILVEVRWQLIESGFFPFTMNVPRFEFRPLGLGANAFTTWSMSPDLNLDLQWTNSNRNLFQFNTGSNYLYFICLFLKCVCEGCVLSMCGQAYMLTCMNVEFRQGCQKSCFVTLFLWPWDRVWLTLVSSKLQWPSYVHTPWYCGHRVLVTIPRHICGCWRSELRSSCSHRK
jgi:hypothetical protein